MSTKKAATKKAATKKAATKKAATKKAATKKAATKKAATKKAATKKAAIKKAAITKKFTKWGKRLETPEIEHTEKVLLFVSYDVCGSTRYKTTSDGSKWADIMKNSFYRLINDYLLILQSNADFSSADPSIWKFAGDEVILKFSVQNVEVCSKIISKAFRLLNILNYYVEKQSKEKMGVKGAAWVVDIDNERNVPFVPNRSIHLKFGNSLIKSMLSNDELKKVTNKNYKSSKDVSEEDVKIFKEICHTGYSQNVFWDYLGADMDEGFRVAAISRRNRMTLDAKLAGILLYGGKQHYVNLIGFTKLKGVWHDRPYPVVWYHNGYFYSRINSPLLKNLNEISEFIDAEYGTSSEHIDLTESVDYEDIHECEFSSNIYSGLFEKINSKKKEYIIKGLKRCYLKSDQKMSENLLSLFPADKRGEINHDDIDN